MVQKRNALDYDPAMANIWPFMTLIIISLRGLFVSLSMHLLFNEGLRPFKEPAQLSSNILGWEMISSPLRQPSIINYRLRISKKNKKLTLLALLVTVMESLKYSDKDAKCLVPSVWWLAQRNELFNYPSWLCEIKQKHSWLVTLVENERNTFQGSSTFCPQLRCLSCKLNH